MTRNKNIAAGTPSQMIARERTKFPELIFPTITPTKTASVAVVAMCTKKSFLISLNFNV